MKNEETIDIYGAREHNLKNIDLSIPRDRLVVFTGLSGSGKSSLAFDTIYAEGQRRYMETFSAYARQFIGGMERPDVDKIEGLSPVISIEQKTTSGNPRSTVGTITEIYDFLRLLYARASVAFSPVSGQPMVSHTDEQICQLIARDYASRRLSILAPVVRSRKGHYRELFESILKAGFLKARIDGQTTDLTPGMRIDRYKTHDIEIIIDRLASPQADSPRLMEAVRTALYHGEGTMMVEDADSGELRYYSRHLMCPESGQSFPLPEPNTFSFNSPKGACPECGGLLNQFGTGTQKLEEHLREALPDVEILRMDADSVSPAGSHEKILSQFREKKVPILIGTQMVTKGLDFENVTLVGVISADQLLYCGDYRAGERCFSLITQVVGRSGRGAKPGRAIIQTFTPQNPVIGMASRQDYEGFYAEEIELRRLQNCPPFSDIVTVTVSAEDESSVLRCCTYIRDRIRSELRGRKDAAVLGPAPLPVVRVSNRYRYRVTLHCRFDKEIRTLVSGLLIQCNTAKEYKGVSVFADYNPME